EEFRALIEDGKLAEWAKVHGKYYGTPLSALSEDSLGGRTPVLDIDVQGAGQVQARITAATVIFLLPPNAQTWVERLTGRGTESPGEIRLRLETALMELEAAPRFRKFVVNQVLEEAVEEIVRVLRQDLHSGLSSLKAEALCGALRDGARSWVRQFDGSGGQEKPDVEPNR
ncbi:MAG: guanylate kinase, partial [Longimicrobiales bacterium]